eukprot:c26682_g1_i1 orf=84-245(+)
MITLIVLLVFKTPLVYFDVFMILFADASNTKFFFLHIDDSESYLFITYLGLLF